MSGFLRDLVITVIKPGSSVQPRLPGRFEKQPWSLGGGPDVDEIHYADFAHKPFSAQSPQPPSDQVSQTKPPPVQEQHGASERPLANAPSSLPENSQLWPERADLETVSGNLAENMRVSSAAQPGPDAQSTPKQHSVHPVPAETIPPDLSVGFSDSEPMHPAREGRSVSLSPPVGSRTQRPMPGEAFTPRADVRLPSGEQSYGDGQPSLGKAGSSPPASKFKSKIRRAGMEQPREDIPSGPTAEPLLGHPSGTVAVEAPVAELMMDASPQREGVGQVSTVQVTIGRIEVRATKPLSQPEQLQAKPLRRQPALPLDQYLQRRNGGGR